MTLVISTLKNIFLLHAKMYKHGTCHEYAKEYIPIAY